MPKYSKLGRQNISPLIMNGWAFDKAAEEYSKYSKLNFGEDLLWYLRNGYVVAHPDFFVMAKPIERDGKRGWFVQMLVGSLGKLLTVIPCPLDFVAFCRSNDDNLRIIDYEECCRRVAALYGYKQ